MGGNTHSKPEEVVRTVSEKFITWFNGIEFEDDAEMIVALVEIKDNCKARLLALEEEDDINEAEATGS